MLTAISNCQFDDFHEFFLILALIAHCTILFTTVIFTMKRKEGLHTILLVRQRAFVKCPLYTRKNAQVITKPAADL
jgi:hypothetical protein